MLLACEIDSRALFLLCVHCRLTDKYNENLDKMYRGGERILHNAYSATVKPLAAIFNFTARPKS